MCSVGPMWGLSGANRKSGSVFMTPCLFHFTHCTQICTQPFIPRCFYTTTNVPKLSPSHCTQIFTQPLYPKFRPAIEPRILYIDMFLYWYPTESPRPMVVAVGPDIVLFSPPMWPLSPHTPSLSPLVYPAHFSAIGGRRFTGQRK